MAASCPLYVCPYIYFDWGFGSDYVTPDVLSAGVGIRGTCHLCGSFWLVYTLVVFNTRDFII